MSLRLVDAEGDCPCHDVSLRISYAMTIIIILDSKSCCQPSCSLSARLLRSSLSAQVHTFQPHCNFSVNQLARLQSVSTAVHYHVPCSFLALCQLSCLFVSSAAVVYSVCCSVLCHAIQLTQTSCKTSAQLESASTFANCHLSCHLLAQVHFVSSAVGKYLLAQF